MNGITNDLLENSKQGILIDKSNKKNLLVSFGGVNQGLGVPVFEFFNSLKDLNCDKIFIRDFNQMWYQKGVDDNINSTDKIKKYLEFQIQNNNYDEICFIGNSMGGYAAILFGTLLDVNNIICFAPQTFIDKKNRLFALDFRWKKQMKKIHKNPLKEKEVFDLKRYLLDNNKYNSKINIYYSSANRLDNIHAKRMKGIKGVILFNHDKGGHQMVKELRDSGKLNEILTNVFNEKK